MRLYLSSYQLGDHPERLTGLVRGDGRGAVIMNALDGHDEDRRRRDLSAQVAALRSLGLDAVDLDLRVTRSDELAARLAGVDFVWVRGGNVFTLRMAMARSGADEALVHALADDRLVYAGFSAGPCVLAPSLRGLEKCDPVSDCERAYGEVRFDGLGILDRPVVPHLDTPTHPESVVLGEVASAYARAGQPFWGLRDGQALVMDGDVTELV
ncbi:Type 1 glutamine amidotransferase-like domain-containing protein [Propioniciclava soli]|uniref:Type 1 glutamine amidotransferase-like domain-containing protein n=1 Tax=Propioniciclava soli TaxID=2775081 RepID=UPI001E4937D5|nr:Type 1 glutamine amidotransferase-like domain-containing protein [Propioniciclava soli]